VADGETVPPKSEQAHDLAIVTVWVDPEQSTSEFFGEVWTEGRLDPVTAARVLEHAGAMALAEAQQLRGEVN
jgi:hypothetical protein